MDRIEDHDLHAIYEIDGLNCYDAHWRQMPNYPGCEMRYGWAIAPDGNRYQHNWIRTADGQLIDLFSWTKHEDIGRRYVPGEAEFSEE